jgi:succinate dehydrogenase / fumarate reductase, flavoprotein subunit
VRRADQLGVPVLEGVYITPLLVHDGAVFGAYGFDLTHGTRYVSHVDAVILAAGDHTRIWRRTSSRRDENTSDAEAARGEGGILRNALGERFMARYDPERMELSTRNRVALASCDRTGAAGTSRPVTICEAVP